MNDTEMLDWLAAHCIFPDEADDRYILPQIAVLVPVQYAVGNDQAQRPVPETGVERKGNDE